MADDVIRVGNPTACHLEITYEPREQMLHLRPKIPAAAPCKIDLDMVRTALVQSFDRWRDQDLRLIFLGRIADYPWISENLTRHAERNSGPLGFWDPIDGHAFDRDDNQYVVDALTSIFGGALIGRPNIPPFRQVAAKYGYRIEGASAEKVLTIPATIKARLNLSNPEASDIKGRLPYDALLHLRIAKTP